jgi:hypothetical protein
MIISKGFVRNQDGIWRNLNTIKYFDIAHTVTGRHRIQAVLKDIDPDNFVEEDGLWDIEEFDTLQEASDELDRAFGYVEQEEVK